MSRSALAILSTENLLHNLQVIRDRVKPAKIIAMIKANAYGHGIRSVGSRLDQFVDLLGVASIDEALALRKHGVNAAIILMQGVFEAHELLLASTEDLHVVFNNEQQIEWLDKSLLPRPLNCWIKVNTGMARLGFSLEEAPNVYHKLMNHSSVGQPVKIISHFACADQKEHPLNLQQIELFNGLIQKIKTSHGDDVELSFCNSAGIFNFPDCHFDYVRPGLALYGVSPIPGMSASEFGLKPVMTLQTSLISIQHLTKGSCVGYGARFICPEDMSIGIAAFGYGDGYPLTAQDGTPVLVNNIECPLVGRVSMDMLAVDLRPCPKARIGDPVILWGDSLPVERVALHTSNITWDMLTGVQHRVKFLWTRRNN
jgi:alanine racemase